MVVDRQVLLDLTLLPGEGRFDGSWLVVYDGLAFWLWLWLVFGVFSLCVGCVFGRWGFLQWRYGIGEIVLWVGLDGREVWMFGLGDYGV